MTSQLFDIAHMLAGGRVLITLALLYQHRMPTLLLAVSLWP